MLEKQISLDYIKAMKAKDSLKSTTLNFLRAQMKNIIIDKKLQELEDVDVIAVIKKQIKQRQDSIEQFRNGGRPELADKEEAEVVILKFYLPEELSEEEIKKIIDEAIAETQATSMKDMGKVMKVVAEKAQGRADNKVVSSLVNQVLRTTG
ncbi:MAG: GatB/YqeY domain-containing protein [Candidatus Omnitrophica bacterium]|nr:GatB/YqeY domain-containing protein [Candidatus Omnitrophota bacterium]MBU1997361.1 GatB/YqeY domain-containing protein [Candidatus Omnitrophota bacterium]MBU4333797.1 GatB/YqeY domain-containing protein [Candidatus Omnitrophota bacterium]